MVSSGIKMPLIHNILCLFFLFCYVKQADSATFNILIPEDVKQDYINFLDGRDPLTIKDFSSPFARRDVVEVNLLEQALFLGGNKLPYQLLTSYKASTHVQRLNNGSVAILGTTVWPAMFKTNTHVLFSDAVIERGKFEAGIYTAPDNHNMLFINSSQSLKNKSAISNRNWVIDWYTLPQLNVNRVWHTEKWTDMVKMVYDKRVDFLLAPFQANDEMALFVEDMKLVPVRGVKVALFGSRHFAVSTKSPYAQQLLKQLNTGLKKLTEQNLIEKAYLESGFYHPSVRDWKKLN